MGWGLRRWRLNPSSCCRWRGVEAAGVLSIEFVGLDVGLLEDFGIRYFSCWEDLRGERQGMCEGVGS